MQLRTLVLFFCVLVGCQNVDSDRKQTAPVTVKLTIDGKPLDEALVTFIQPTPGNPPAAGKTNAEGIAKLMTYEVDDGAVLGEHNVQVIKTTAPPAGAVADQDSPEYDPNATPTISKLKSLIPERYSLPGKSGFKADVKAGNNEFTFELKSK